MSEWLNFHQLSLGYGRNPVLSGLNVAVPSDVRVLALLGPSGCGKTTLLRAIAGILRPLAGAILVGGHPVVRPGRDRPIVLQNDPLFPWYTILENVAFSYSCTGLGRRRSIGAARNLLERFGLTAAAHLIPAQVSGGMRQRVGIARALATGSPYLLLDEPLSSLDESRRDEVIAMLREAVTDGTRIVIASHDLVDTALIADAALVFRHSEPLVLACIRGRPKAIGPEERYGERVLAAARHLRTVMVGRSEEPRDVG